MAFRTMGYAIFYRPDELAGDVTRRLEFWQGRVLTQRERPLEEETPEGGAEPGGPAGAPSEIV